MCIRDRSSIAPDIVDQVRQAVGDAKRVLVCLDSNHTHDHVLAELQAYAPMTSVGSYCVVFDTVIEDMPAELCAHRPWGQGNSPKSAVRAWLPPVSYTHLDVYKRQSAFCGQSVTPACSRRQSTRPSRHG